MKSFSCTAIVLDQNSSLDKTDAGKESKSIYTDFLRSPRKTGKDLGKRFH